MAFGQYLLLSLKLEQGEISRDSGFRSPSSNTATPKLSLTDVCSENLGERDILQQP